MLTMIRKNIERIITLLLIIGIGFGIYTMLLKPAPESVSEQEQTVKENPGLTQFPTDGFFNTSLQNASGVTEALETYRGKTIIVNFWATWCPPCREEMPELSVLHQENQDNDIVVLGLAIDELEAVTDYLEASPVSYPIYIAESQGMAMSAQLGNKKGVLPYTAIIDAKGRIANTFYGKVNQTMLLTAIENKP